MEKVEVKSQAYWRGMHHKPVGTWLPVRDYELLKELAQNNNVPISTYVRGIIVDAIQDENCIIQSKVRIVSKAV